MKHVIVDDTEQAYTAGILVYGNEVVIWFGEDGAVDCEGVVELGTVDCVEDGLEPVVCWWEVGVWVMS